MTNFQKFKCELTPEQLAGWILCSACPLYNNTCDGFTSVQLEANNDSTKGYRSCVNKLVTWFNQEASE